MSDIALTPRTDEAENKRLKEEIVEQRYIRRFE